jgi:thiol-disulfide isomerase/thioredoxin
MRPNLRANIELAAQVVIAIAVVITAGVLIKRNVWPSPASGRLPSINAGERLTIPNVDWAQNKKTLVFFLKKDCPYCTTSAGLYRQLVEDAAKRNVRCLAVFPNTPEEARKYLQYLELPIENVYTGPLGNSKISGTPTVLFVDESGIVRSVWIGAQTDKEQEMRDKLLPLFDS